MLDEQLTMLRRLAEPMANASNAAVQFGPRGYWRARHRVIGACSATPSRRAGGVFKIAASEFTQGDADAAPSGGAGFCR